MRPPGVLLGAAVCALVAIGSAGAQRRPSPEVSAIHLVRVVMANDYRDAWRLLASAEKKSVPRAVYVGCERRQPIRGRLMRVRAVDVRRRMFPVPGLSGRHGGYAVTLQATIGGLTGGTTVTTQFVVRVIADHGRYSWVLHQPRFNAYRLGRCLHATLPT
jgi:hypothetical protein